MYGIWFVLWHLKEMTKKAFTMNDIKEYFFTLMLILEASSEFEVKILSSRCVCR